MKHTNHFKRILAMVLCLCMVLGMAPLSALATEEPATVTLYFNNTENWSTVNIYYWNSGNTNMTTWPGNGMNDQGNGIWSFNVPADATHVIFNNGSTQTGDIPIPTDGSNCYAYGTQSWSVYSAEGGGDGEDIPAAETVTVYFENTARWSSVRIYYWTDGAPSLVTWPGDAMHQLEGKIWYCDIPAEATHVIFNNGSTQTGDLPLPTDGSNCYAFGTQSWSVYPAGGGGEEEALTGYTVDIGGTVTAYTDFNEAIGAACAAEAATLTLYQDAEAFWCSFVGGNVTLNLNGKTVNTRPTVKECTLTVTDTAEIKGTVVNYAGAAFDYVSGKLIILDTTDCLGAGEGHEPWRISRDLGAAADAGTIGTTGTEDIVIPAGCVAISGQTNAPTSLLPPSGYGAVIHRHTWVDATCTDPKTCTGCGAVEGEALGHSFGEDGICLNCGADKNSITINMTDSYGDGWNGNAIAVYEDSVLVATVTLNQTEGASGTWMRKYDPEKEYSFYWVKGVYAYECSFEILIDDEVVFEASTADCTGYTDGYMFYPVCDHSYAVTAVVDPTCTEGGYTAYECSLCGDSYEGDFKDPTGHIVDEDGKCTGCGMMVAYAVNIGGTVTAYTDFSEAVDAACAAEAATLTLYQDVEAGFYEFTGGNMTVDLNGKTSNGRFVVIGCTLTVTDTAETKGTVVNYAGAALTYNSGKLIILDTTDFLGVGEGHEPWRINRGADAAADAGTIGTTGTEDVVLPADCVAINIQTKTPTTLLPLIGCVAYIHRHTWADATCTAPKTCTGCNATEGEPVPENHEWADATCTAPKTCTRCGAIEGDPSSHSLGEDGKCTGCGMMAAYAVNIGGTVTAYTDFNEAVDAACAAEAATLTLYQDVEVISCWFVGGNVTLNLNGKTVNSRPTVNECTLTVTDTAEIKGTVVNYAGAAFDYVSGKLIILDTTDCFGAGEGHKPWLINRSIDAAEDAGTIGTTGTEDIVIPAGCVALNYQTKAPITLLPPSGYAAVIHRHTWVDATCTAPKTCTGCGATEGEEKHVWTDATCTDPKTCTSCGAVEGEALGHSFGEDGICLNCGEYKNYITINMTDAYGDGWGGNAIAIYEDGVPVATITVESGRTATWTGKYDPEKEYSFYWVKGNFANECSFEIVIDGEVVFEASKYDCSDYSNGQRFYPECDHDYTVTVVDPTCTEDGYTAYDCPLCGKSYKTDWKEELGHSFDGDICTVCGHDLKNVITINMTDSYGDGWTGNALAFYVDGELVETVTVDRNSSASWTYEYDSDKEYEFYWVMGSFPEECAFEILICGEVVIEAADSYCGSYPDGYRVFPACEHVTEEGKVTPPSCFDDGYTDYTCTVCGLSYRTDIVKAPGHHTKSAEAAVVTLPTCTYWGYTTYTCPVCDAVFEDDYVEMLGHVRGEDGNCTVCDEVYSVAIWVAGVQITAENMEDILGDGTASFDDATDTLTLNGFNYIGEEKGIYSEIPLNIVLVGENTITGSYIGIDSYVMDGAINISGTGTLTIDSSHEGMYVSSTYGVCLTIGGSVTINLINNNNQVPFYMYGDTVDLVITDNAKLTIGTEDAPVEEECIYVEGYTSGSVTISGNAEVHLENNDEEGIYVTAEQESITITGGSFYADTEEEGLDADTITISGGTVEAYGDVGYEGIYARDLTITGGIITVGGKEQGIEAENITITGGILTVVEGGLIAVGDDGLPGTITLTGVQIVEPQGATIGTFELEEEGTVKAVLNADGTYADAFVIRPVEGDVKNGIVAEDGKLYYYENDVRTYAGLIKIGSDYYYVRTSGEVVTSRSYWITKTNDLLPAANYYFGETGKLGDKNGFFAEDGGIYYYEDGVRTYAGLIEVDGDYYYVRSSGEVVTDRHYWITKTNDLLPANSYYFNEEGKLYPPVDEVKSGIYQEGDKLFYYENNQRTYGGLMLYSGGLKKMDGTVAEGIYDNVYIYVRTSGEVVIGRGYWITKTNDLLPVGNYTFDENGVMTNPPA